MPGQQKVILSSDSDAITAEELVKSLGKYADQYVVVGVKKEK